MHQVHPDIFWHIMSLGNFSAKVVFHYQLCIIHQSSTFHEIFTLLSVQPVPEIVSLCKSFATSYIAQFRSLFKLHIPAICAVGEQ